MEARTVNNLPPAAPHVRGDRVQRLEQLHAADGQTLPPRLMAEILRELQRLELVIGMIKTIEAERDAIASAKTETEPTSAKQIQDLAKIKCIGPEFASTLVGEVFYRSFDNRKQLASYVGLTPAHFQSGATCQGLRLGSIEQTSSDRQNGKRINRNAVTFAA
jgi:transposase